MTSSSRRLLIAIILLLAVGAGFFVFFHGGDKQSIPGTTDATTTPEQITSVAARNGMAEIGFGQAASFQGIAVTPLQILEDSRCPVDVTCIQAGRVRLQAVVAKGESSSTQEFIIGEPVSLYGTQITLVAVSPKKVSTKTITKDAYQFTFKFAEAGFVYKNASSDVIQTTLPLPGDVVGKDFKVLGKARGSWFFEASFPVQVLDKDGNVLASTPAHATSDWMTSDFVPFEADLVIPDSYTGPATLVLKNDNPSGMPEKDASVSFPITIEY